MLWAVAAICLLLGSCSKISRLYVFNDTNSTMTLIVSCDGEKAEEFEVPPGEWTDEYGCYQPENFSIGVKGQTGSAYQLTIDAKSQSRNYLDTTFVRLDSTGIRSTSAPFWYVIQQPVVVVMITVGSLAVFSILVLIFSFRKHKYMPDTRRKRD
ncbi:MAG: hypothetical protein IH944_10100 [Armatimonadetes bacterium]|nr:hypothetical protein [Armatimonadota bacterium]